MSRLWRVPRLEGEDLVYLFEDQAHAKADSMGVEAVPMELVTLGREQREQRGQYVIRMFRDGGLGEPGVSQPALNEVYVESYKLIPRGTYGWERMVLIAEVEANNAEAAVKKVGRKRLELIERGIWVDDNN